MPLHIPIRFSLIFSLILIWLKLVPLSRQLPAPLRATMPKRCPSFAGCVLRTTTTTKTASASSTKRPSNWPHQSRLELSSRGGSTRRRFSTPSRRSLTRDRCRSKFSTRWIFYFSLRWLENGIHRASCALEMERHWWLKKIDGVVCASLVILRV